MLNDAVFAVYDISDLKGMSLDTNEGANPVLNNYFVKVGKSVDLNELFASDGFVSTLASREYALLNSHCNTVSLEGSILTANQNDIVYLSVSDGSSCKTMTVYVVNDDDALSTEDYFVIPGVGIYFAKTGHNYVQIVDQTEHSLPVAGFEMTLYDEEELLTPVVTVTTDLFGMVDLSELTLENKKEAGNYYFKDYD